MSTTRETNDDRAWDDLNTDLNLDEDTDEDWGETIFPEEDE